MSDLNEYDYLWDGSEPGWVIWKTQTGDVEGGKRNGDERNAIFNEFTGKTIVLPDEAAHQALEDYLQSHGIPVRKAVVEEVAPTKQPSAADSNSALWQPENNRRSTRSAKAAEGFNLFNFKRARRHRRHRVSESPDVRPEPVNITPALPDPLRARRIRRGAIALACLVVAGIGVWYIHDRLTQQAYSPKLWNLQIGETGDAGDTRADVSVVDMSGNVYIAGTTTGSLFHHNAGGEDFWLARYNATGNLEWTRQYGTDEDDSVNGIAVDHKGNIILVGGTGGSLFGQNLGGIDTYHPHNDAFVMKIASNGSTVWAKQVGGVGDEAAQAVAVTAKDTIFVAGDTDGSLFHDNAGLDVSGDPALGSSDVFLAKFDSDGHREWAVQYGGPGDDDVSGIALSEKGGGYITGGTYQWFQPNNQALDDYVAKFDGEGKISWGAQVHVDHDSFPSSILLTPSGNVQMAARLMFGTFSQHANPGIVEFDADGHYLRRSEFEVPASIRLAAGCIDPNGGIWVGGSARGKVFGPTLGADDAVVAYCSPDGKLKWGKQFGTDADDVITGLNLDGRGYAYATGKTDGSLFAPYTGGDDAIVMKLSPSGDMNRIQTIKR